MITLQNSTKTKAVKDHKCNFCGGRIPKGHHYMRSSHILDTVYTWKAHEECEEIAIRLKMYDNCDNDYGLTEEDFTEEITSEYMDLMHKMNPHVFPVFKPHLEMVQFRYKLGAVIRHYKQLDKKE